MAVTLTERFRADIAGKKLIMYECVLAVESNAITAASLGLTWVDAAWICPIKQTLSAGSLTGQVLKYGAASTGITISGVDTAADSCVIAVIGW